LGSDVACGHLPLPFRTEEIPEGAKVLGIDELRVIEKLPKINVSNSGKDIFFFGVYVLVLSPKPLGLVSDLG
jgi:hypothetical protein